MSRSSARTALLILAPLTVAGLAQAQYIGPGTTRAPGSLTELLQNPTDGQSVQLRGRLLQKLNHNKYLFSDGKSQIRVEIEADVFPKQAIDDKTEIEITGEVEKDFMETPEIDVDRAEVVTPALRKTP
ncbi:MAG: NirD/YgiW/YdeI family stress tolerance protein [Pseudomonadota bacterium]